MCNSVADDFQDVRKEVGTLTGLWDGVAVCLGLTRDSVREIELKYRGDPLRCLDEVIEGWLNQNYNYGKFGLPSWRGLVSAVADGSGGKNSALAKKIAEKHKKCECLWNVMWESVEEGMGIPA